MKIVIDTKKYTKYCVNCGRIYDESHNYCPKCDSDKPLFEIEYQ